MTLTALEHAIMSIDTTRDLVARNPAMVKGHSGFVAPGMVSLSYRCVNYGAL